MAARFKKSREASLARADGVVWSRNFLTTPPRPLHSKEASQLLLDVAVTPPPAEEGSSWNPYPILVCAQTSFSIGNPPCIAGVPPLHSYIR